MQLDIFDLMYPPFKINKEIALIEFFGGYGSQALSLKYANIPFKHHKLCEWAVNSIQAYKDVHMENDNTDYSKELSVSEIKDYLFNKGISKNWNEPMTREQIDRLKEKEARTIYNNIQATHNLVNIQQVKGEDLDITDKEHFTYLLTYSFPCQDISGAGKMAGFSDTSTRSGMLWEVERILKECKDKPDVLLMENVPLIHSQDNIGDFNKWIQSLENMGYKNYWQDLIATDYGIPQTRNRTFMVSVLGNYKYTFPKPIPLKLKLKDMLEDNVDEKYYLSDKLINFFTHNEEKQKENGNGFRFNVSDGDVIAKTITTSAGNRMDDNFIKIKNANAKGYLEATDGDGIDISGRMEYHRGTVQKGKSQTITTSGGEDVGVLINDEEKILKKDLCNKLIQEGLVEEGDVVKHSYTQQILDGNKKCVEKNDGNMITLTTRGDCVGICVKPKVLGGIGKKDSNNNTQWKQQNRVYDNNVSISITTAFNQYYKNNLRIRKLTPRECGRLMGVKDEDITKILKHQSNASAYHLAGDSIVCDVLVYIFKNMMEDTNE